MVAILTLRPPVVSKNSVRPLYQPTRHGSNRVTTEKVAAKKSGFPRESGDFTVTRKPVAVNQPPLIRGGRGAGLARLADDKMG